MNGYEVDGPFGPKLTNVKSSSECRDLCQKSEYKCVGSQYGTDKNDCTLFDLFQSVHTLLFSSETKTLVSLILEWDMIPGLEEQH